MAEKTVLTVDLGAESGRVMAASFDGGRLATRELHRFANPHTAVNGLIHWDFLHLWREIENGISAGRGLNPYSVGVDTWGVDFALLDWQGNLIGNPVGYRDARTEGMMEKVFERVPREEVFARTGIQFMRINTLYQLMSMVEQRSPQLEIADTLLMAPDLLNYWLTGAKVSEFTNATTSQMYDPRAGDWAMEMLQKVGIPTDLLPAVVPPGTKIGAHEGLTVIAPGTHDTASAVAAVPTDRPEYAYISSGTWSLVGLEVAEPIINEDALAANITNEGGVYGTFRLLKNCTGLWIVQQCRRAWADLGEDYSYPDLVAMAQQAPPLVSLIDPNDETFLAPGDHPRLVQAFCARTGQTVPQTKGALLRAVLEGLALTYHRTVETLRGLSGQPVQRLHIVGGGTQNELLNQMTADATGLPVYAGPIEATVLGNALVQLITLGEIADLAQGREIVARSEQMTCYEPRQTDEWREAYARFLAL
jgi:rhamnulokinase